MQITRSFVAIATVCAVIGLSACSDPDDDIGGTPERTSEAMAPVGPAPVPGTPAVTDAAQVPVQPVPPGDAAEGTVAVAHIEPMPMGPEDNKVTGSIQFSPTTTGIELSGRLMNIATGKHGIHIHKNGSCEDPGTHFAPDDKQHGDPKQGERHLGDLGNVEADTANEAWVSINVEGLTLKGDNSILGHTLVVHADPDDLKSQPAGNSGDPIACGVIEADGDAEVRPESQATVSESGTGNRG